MGNFRFVFRIVLFFWVINISLFPSNAFAQSTVGMEISKNFGPTLSALTPSIPNTTLFPTTISCTNGYVTTTNLSAQGQYGNNFVSVNNLPIGSTCTIIEDATQFPPLPAGCSWNAPQITPSASILIAHGQHFPQVMNDVTCTAVSGDVSVEKVMSVSTDMQPPSGTSFAVNVSCTNPTQSYSGQQSVGLSTISVMAANGSSCTVTEDVSQLPTLPNGCTWDAPTYPNGNTVTVPASSSGTGVQIVNSISCPPPTAPVTITKTIDPASVQYLPSGVSFDINTNCTNPNSTTSTSIVVGSGSSASNSIAGLVVGSNCIVTENISSLPALSNGCTWDTPSYPNGNSVTVTNSGNSVEVLNAITCPPQSAPITVTKRIDPASMPYFTAGSSFDINADCTNPTASTSASVTITTGSAATTSLGNMTVGSNCTVTEDTASLPSLPAGCTWNAPTYPNGNSVTIAGAGNPTILVMNSIVCVPQTGGVEIFKSIDPSSDFTPSPTGAYAFDVNCQNGNIAQGTITGASHIALIGIPAPTSCTVVEDMNHLPAIPAHCTWDMPVYPNGNSVSIAVNSTTAVPVVNSVTCQTGDAEIIKKFDGDIPDAAGYSYGGTLPITAECTPGSGNFISGTISTSGGSISGLPAGQCLISEDITQLPALSNGCTWNPPSYFPTSQIINIPNSSPFVISNSISCPDETGTISVEKTYGKLSKQIPGAVFNLQLLCTDSQNPSTTLTLTPTFGVGGTFVNNIPLGFSCVVTEVPPFPLLPAGCSWASPQYPNGNNVNVNNVIANYSQTVVIENNVKCKKVIDFDDPNINDSKSLVKEPKQPVKRR